MDKDKLRAMAESCIIAEQMQAQEFRVRVWALIKYIMDNDNNIRVYKSRG